MKTRQKIYLPLKRAIAIFGSLVGIVFCLVLFWWWVFPINLISSKGHPFFLQERYGKKEKVFKVIKFRTMKVDADPNKAPNEIDAAKRKTMETRFGSFLRKTSIDETPQLFNILAGQMAFIGPRPGSAHNEEDLRELRKKYSPNAFDVRPGMSGLAQVKMRRTHNPELKAKLDAEYASTFSLFLDTKLFIFTILNLFSSVKGE